MYSWDEDTSSWYGSAKYAYAPAAAPARADSAARANAAGPRTYQGKSGPNEKIIDAKKSISTQSKNPLIVAIDVTGSMANWPFEIFDRLPLLYNTLAQYRPDEEICFAAIGDAGVDRWPIQVTSFASGFDLEQLLGSLYGLGCVPNETRLSGPALETLAVIAYRQPASRAEIEAVRGVNCGEIVRQLMERDLVRIQGRSEELGRPYLYATTRRFGTILENVVFDPVTRLIDLDDDRRTENTRASYPLGFIENAVESRMGGHPRNIIFLTCDASGVMPPIARLSPDQALYQFMSGYTSKIAGTEVGLGKEPEMTFSTCFGAPFMVAGASSSESGRGT